MKSIDQRVDPEALAALIDGTLSPDERARVLASLASSDEGHDALLELQSIVDGLADVSATTAGLADEPRRSRGRGSSYRKRGFFVMIPVLAAAVLAVVLAMPQRDQQDGTLAVVRSLASPSKGGSMPALFGTSWDVPGWSAVRGAEDELSQRARAFRIGARFAELELALSIGDTAAIRTTSISLVRLVSPLNAAVGAQVEQLVESGEAPAAKRAALAGQLRKLISSRIWFDLGAWSESARLAASSGQVAFFAQSGAPMTEHARLLAAIDRLGAEELRETMPLRDHLHSIDSVRIASKDDLMHVAAIIDSMVAIGGR